MIQSMQSDAKEGLRATETNLHGGYLPLTEAHWRKKSTVCPAEIVMTEGDLVMFACVLHFIYLFFCL